LNSFVDSDLEVKKQEQLNIQLKQEQTEKKLNELSKTYRPEIDYQKGLSSFSQFLQ
jgi:hypothetical protein